MKKASIIFGMVCLISVSVIRAQVCGTYGDTQEAFIPDLKENIRLAETNPIQLRSTLYLPIKFHIVTKSDGSEGAREARILDQLTAINEDFADMDIQFYLKDCSFNYINNTTVFENHEATIGTIMKVNRDANAINVFIPESAQLESNESNILGYYSPSASTSTTSFTSDWIVIRKDETSGNSITLTHELGHFFTLAHPHRGWESSPYQLEEHGNPVTLRAPNGSFSELQDGTNCDITGDLLCDTPPDYNFGAYWTNCDYDAGTKDPNGDVVNPEEKLYMGYFNFCELDSYFFSPMQKAAAKMSANGDKRKYIRQGWTPGEAPITLSATLEFPIQDERLPYYNDIPFAWTPVPGANKYVLEISRFSNYVEGDKTFSFVVSANSKTVDGLEANRKYYWRVRPFNCYDTGAPFTNSGTFITGTVTKVEEPEFVEGWTAGPNPVSINSTLNLTINSTEAFEGQISWYSMNGQRIKSEYSQRFINGSNRISLSTSQLTAGVYVLALETAAGRLTKRIAVLP